MILHVWKLVDGRTFDHVADVDYASSVIWIRRLRTAGEFEIYIRASAAVLELFKGDTFITRDDSDIAMMVEKIVLDTDVENGDYFTITGRSAEAMLSWRIIPRANYTAADTTAERIIRDLLSQYALPSEIFNNPTQFPFLSIEQPHGWQDLTTHQFTGRVLEEVISELCTAYEYGYLLYWTGSGFEFRLFKGTDRSFAQKENPYVVFSPRFENISNTEYINDSTNYANAAYIAGQGEGKDRVITYVYPENVEGFALRQIYVDARNTSSNTESGELSDNQYRKLLQSQGRDAIAEHKRIQTFSGEVLTTNSYRYGVDYSIGDKVAVENSYGVKGGATITEITEVEDDEGYKLIPTLGEWTLLETEGDQ